MPIELLRRMRKDKEVGVEPLHEGPVGFRSVILVERRGGMLPLGESFGREFGNARFYGWVDAGKLEALKSLVHRHELPENVHVSLEAVDPPGFLRGLFQRKRLIAVNVTYPTRKYQSRQMRDAWLGQPSEGKP